MTDSSFLSPEFLKQYEGVRPKNAGILFDVVYLRTYSRLIPEQNRRERWDETIARVVNYSMSLYSGPNQGRTREAEHLYDKIFNLEVLPAGRSLWVGGTESAKKFGESQFNCFTRDTEFLTPGGFKTFSDFNDGDSVNVLGRFASWKEAKVKNFGKAKIYSLNLIRGKQRKTIRTTNNHRWVVRKYDAPGDHTNEYKTTVELNPGDRFSVVKRYSNLPGGCKIQPCSVAIQHGLVFGDGTFVKAKGSCLIDLCDDSQQFSSLFSTGREQEEGKHGGVITKRHTRISNLPYNWKELPSLGANPEYLLGFLMGWFAADGGFAGSPKLSSATKENLEWARSALALIGIYTGNILMSRESNPFTGEYGPLYSLSLHKEDITEDFFLKKTHKDGFVRSDKKLYWKVESVIEEEYEEDVWCVQEPEQECFTLSNGILTKNCSFTVIDNIEAFGDLFHLLLVGCGVGFRILPTDTAKLPQFNVNFELHNQGYFGHPPEKRQDETDFYENWGDNPTCQFIEVGDSREGWVKALRTFLEILVDPNHRTELPQRIILDYNNVRPAGERIKTFGGKAPGPHGLMEMFKDIARIIKSSGGFLSPLDCMDVNNLIGKNVIVGGTRRSSQIALGCPNDKLFVEAKKDLWVTKTNLHRTMSNNSVVFTEEKPSREKIDSIFDSILLNGEPGFQNLSEARRRRPNAHGTNPCSEVLMDNRGFCNLSTVVITSHVENDRLNWEKLEDSFRQAVRIGLRQTNITISLPAWDLVQKRDRLLGVSMTGILDAFDSLGWKSNSDESKRFFKFCRWVAHDEAQKYSFEMRVPCPLLTTTIKPEGSLSQLPTVSSGIHRSHAPHYIRRIRVSTLDPVFFALNELGVPWELDINKAERAVFSFPLKTAALTSSAEEPAIDQLNRYLETMEHYTDHNTSITIQLSPAEKEEIVDRVHEKFDSIVGCAFLPKYTDAYPQMPYEEISKEQYEEMIKTFPDLSSLTDLVNKYEAGEEQELIEESCSVGGQCPIR